MSPGSVGLTDTPRALSGLHARDSRSPRALVALAACAAVAVGAVYPVSALAIHPLALPVGLAGVVLLVLAAGRPGLAVAVAFALTALNPGLVGAGAWIPSLGWIALFFGFTLLDRTEGRGASDRLLPPLALPVVAYVLAMVVAFAISPDRSSAIPLLRSALTGLLLFFVAATGLSTWQRISTALAGASFAAVVVGGVATLQLATGASSGIGFITSTGLLVNRATGGLGHPNQLGGFLVLLVPLAAAGLVLDRRCRALHASALVLALTGIYASFSRGALLAVLVMPFVLLRGRSLVILLPVAILALSVGAPSVMQERFATGGDDGTELAGRADIWSTAVAMWADRPYLGVGLGGFATTYSEIRVVGKRFLPDTRFQPPPHAHNLGLQVLAEQGILGALLLAALFGSALVRSFGLRSCSDRRRALLATGIFTSTVGFLVHNVFDVTLLENTGIQLFGVLGVLSALISLDAQDQVDRGS